MSRAILPFPSWAARRSPRPNRRVWIRYPCSRQTLFQLGNEESYILWWARVRDVSANGIGLLLRREFELDTELVIELPVELHEPLRLLRVRVRHLTESPEGQWLTGCEFHEPLPESDLAVLLRIVSSEEALSDSAS